MVHGRPVVAYSHAVVALRDGQLAAVPSADSIVGMSLIGSDRLHVQIGNRLRTLDSDGFSATGPTIGAGSSLTSAGASTILESKQTATGVTFAAVPATGRAIPMFGIQGKLRKAAWNGSALIAVVSGTLISWSTGDATATVLSKDAVLEQARDLCSIGPGRAVVALPNTVVLYAHGRRTTLVAMQARCFWDGTTLFLLDQRRSAIWSVEKLGLIGEQSETTSHIQQLSTRAKTARGDGDRAFGELVRLVGYAEAARLSGRPERCEP
jgi:hypothetical protein